jgi:peroxiredoxin
MKPNDARQSQLKSGDPFPTLQLQTITGEPVAIPGTAGALTHQQFRRFAGCPICNLHLRSITRQLDEITNAGIHEVVVFHSTPKELLTYQNDMPFAVVGDPDRKLYRQFGVESGARAILNPRAWRSFPVGLAATIRNAIAKRRGLLPVNPNGGNLGLPADVLIAPDGRVVAVKYGTHAYDQWSVEEILAHATRPPATV